MKDPTKPKMRAKIKRLWYPLFRFGVIRIPKYCSSTNMSAVTTRIIARFVAKKRKIRLKKFILKMINF